MAGAGEHTRRVRVVNANYEAPEAPGRRGRFSLLLVTEDDERHLLEPDVEDVVALLALVRSEPVLLWDPDARTLIAANVMGEWLPTTWSALPETP